ncbi:hypothetical protein GJ496_001150 [Pomphorhynchus laevis]|nr:hypothetical protein GJ496_001150 [Pomphorhynchus laevis]
MILFVFALLLSNVDAFCQPIGILNHFNLRRQKCLTITDTDLIAKVDLTYVTKIDEDTFTGIVDKKVYKTITEIHFCNDPQRPLVVHVYTHLDAFKIQNCSNVPMLMLHNFVNLMHFTRVNFTVNNLKVSNPTYIRDLYFSASTLGNISLTHFTNTTNLHLIGSDWTFLTLVDDSALSLHLYIYLSQNISYVIEKISKSYSVEYIYFIATGFNNPQKNSISNSINTTYLNETINDEFLDNNTDNSFEGFHTNDSAANNISMKATTLPVDLTKFTNLKRIFLNNSNLREIKIPNTMSYVEYREDVYSTKFIFANNHHNLTILYDYLNTKLHKYFWCHEDVVEELIELRFKNKPVIELICRADENTQEVINLTQH